LLLPRRFALTEAGYESIMVNCNPETVSTDYDTSDRLYFEPLTAEDVLEILRAEQQNGTLHGVIVQFGGQTPLKLADALEAGHPDPRHHARRHRPRRRPRPLPEALHKLGLKQPKNGIAYSVEQARTVAGELGFPLVVRPSYVLGGRAMQIIHDEGMRNPTCSTPCPAWCRKTSSRNTPTTRPARSTRCWVKTRCCSTAICGAIEVDVDCLSDGKDVFVAGIMEHIEEAGIHSGDSACSLPPYSLTPEIIAELERQTKAMAMR
jgi:carbamoyl-phosphate synthase large subunit